VRFSNTPSLELSGVDAPDSPAPVQGNKFEFGPSNINNNDALEYIQQIEAAIRACQ
jgi:hypothetical protein